MYPRSFEYARAESVEHAIELLREHGEDARVLAGGASLIPLMKLRLANPTHLIDIGRLRQLAGVQQDDGSGGFVVGALTRHVDLERHVELGRRLPIVRDAAASIGDAQVRNMGTIGGGLAEADPAGDWPPVLLALDGAVRVQGPSGERIIQASELFVDAYTTSLAHEELITEVLLPARVAGSAHLKLERRAGDFAVANCAVALTTDAAGERCESVRIGLGGVSLSAMRVPAAEAILMGEPPSEPRLAEAAVAVANADESYDDVRASAEYRRHLGGVLFRRAFDLAWRRATSGR